MTAQNNVQQLRDALADRYRIEGELGRGGMATVYLAEDLKHRRHVAVKVLHAEHSAAVGKERFLREISVIIPWGLGFTYAMLGRIDEADVRAEWLMTHAPQMPYAPQLKSLVLSLQGRQDEAAAMLKGVDTAVLDGHQSWHLAESFAMAGAHEQALRLLDQAIERGAVPVIPFARKSRSQCGDFDNHTSGRDQMNRTVIAPLAGVLLACAAGAAHGQTDLRSIDLGSLVLDGERMMRRDASGRLASLPDGRYQLPRDASLIVSLGKIASFTCPECSTTQSGSTIDGSTFKTNDSQCALEYQMKYAPIGSTPLIYSAKQVKWPMATRLDAPLGAYNESSNISPYVLKNISSLRMITVKEKRNESTYELAVGHQRGYVGVALYPPYIEWTDCGEPDPVVVAAREEKHKTELVAAAVSAVREYLNQSR